jgi:hypothetical protein
MVLVSFVSYGQVDITKLNNLEKKIVQTFKDTYVESHFKDPYSFKLLKLEIKPKTFGDWLMDDINYIQNEIKFNTTSYSKIDSLQDLYHELLSLKVKHPDSPLTSLKPMARIEKIRQERLENLKKKLNENIKEYSEMSSDKKNKIKGYEVRIDCYGNNSYGNPILGRYKFNYLLFDKNMLPINYYGIDKLHVKELN